jgi:hypothetical protein
VAKSLIQYYGYSPRQCDLVDTAFGYSGTGSSCVNVKDGGYYEDSPYNQGLSPTNTQKVLARWGESSTVTGGYLSQSECVTEITAQRPFYISKKWGTPSNILGGHALLAYGYDGMFINYWDPARLDEGGGQKQVPYTSLVSNPTAPVPYFWGNTVKNINKSTGANTWYLADITPPDGVHDGYAYIYGYVNSQSSRTDYYGIHSEVSFGTTTSYEKGTSYFSSGVLPETPRPAFVGYAEIVIPFNAANTTYHYQVRTIEGYNNTIDLTNDQTFFVPSSYQTYPLTISKTGSGTVTNISPSSPAINCGSTCSASYAQNTSVTLQATPDPGKTFIGWTGCNSVNANSCTVSMSTSRSVVANFATQSFFTHTVSKLGTGTGTVTSEPAGINCGTICSNSFAQDIPVIFTATPDPGMAFTGWIGCSDITGNGCFSYNRPDNIVYAQFTPLKNIAVSKFGTGKGYVVYHTADPTDSNSFFLWDNTTSSTFYPQNTTLTLAANPLPGNIFTGWSGACSGKGTCNEFNSCSCSVTLNTDQAVSATFVPDITPILNLLLN